MKYFFCVKEKYVIVLCVKENNVVVLCVNNNNKDVLCAKNKKDVIYYFKNNNKVIFCVKENKKLFLTRVFYVDKNVILLSQLKSFDIIKLQIFLVFDFSCELLMGFTILYFLYSFFNSILQEY